MTKAALRPLALLLIVGAVVGCGSTQPTAAPATNAASPAAPTPAAAVAPFSEAHQQLPLDPAVERGMLPNGLTYYIRQHDEPRGRAELRLVVNAGSILEDEDQRGLAHFVEHMAFNGTENFAKQELVDYIESIGMRFGADLNAYTSFDETVYMLTVPTDDPELLRTGVQILSEWAARISFEDEEIDKERGVVIEEWRLGRGAQARIFDKQAPVVFHDSRYAERLPIGSKEILESAPYDALRRFYREWYRPDLMAVIAVGDFDPDVVKGLIRSSFGDIPGSAEARPRPAYPVPDHEATLITVTGDPEATNTIVRLMRKLPKQRLIDEDDYRRSLVEGLYDAMMNRRLAERSREAEPPFVASFSGAGNLVREKGSYNLIALVEEGGVERGLTALLTEAERVHRYGFTATELEREKAALLRSMEQAYRERDTVKSDAFAAEYARNFLQQEAAPGIARELELANDLVPGITLDEVNALAERWLAESDRVITVSGPEKPDITLPGEQAVAAVLAAAEAAEVAPYVDEVADRPLMATAPALADIVSSRTIDELGVTEWRLANGVRVVLKPTDFKRDEILFTAFSPGGTSLVPDSDFIAAATADSLVLEGGVASFDLTQLQKLLADKVVRVGPYISDLEEGISGSASPEDVETMFQLIYLYVTEPRRSEQAFASVSQRYRALVENRLARPEAVYADTVTRLVTQDHFRRRPWTQERLDRMDLDASMRIYQDRFADASDFTFIFVGSFELETLRPLVQRYLGSLPDLGRVETWHDVGVEAPEGVIEETVVKGIEPKSQVTIVFPSDFEWTRENRYLAASMADVLRIRLRELVREEESGTYGVSVRVSTERIPRPSLRLTVGFGCDPDRVDELKASVYDEIRRLQTEGPDAEHVAKVQQQDRRAREVQLRENGFWLASLESSWFNGEDPLLILRFDELVDSLTPEAIRAAAERWIHLDRRIEVVLLPEELEVES